MPHIPRYSKDSYLRRVEDKTIRNVGISILMRLGRYVFCKTENRTTSKPPESVESMDQPTERLLSRFENRVGGL